MILLLVPLGTTLVAWQWGGRMAVGFAVGGGLAYLNYRWIVAVVDALVRAGQARVPRRIYLKLFLPLVLLGILLYVIFSRSALSPVGVLSGVLLLAVAVLLEAFYQIFLEVRR